MGHLTLLLGCMFAQKTTELVRRIRRYKSIGYNVLVVNHSSDTRYGNGDQIISHDRVLEHGVAAESLADVDAAVRSGDYRVVAIDEGQFFGDLFHMVTLWADTLPIHIVVAGLDGTSERSPFGDMLRLIPHAEEVDRLSAFCAVCKDGTVANFSQFVGVAGYTEETGDKRNEVVVGGAELYRPVCRVHFLATATASSSVSSVYLSPLSQASTPSATVSPLSRSP